MTLLPSWHAAPKPAPLVKAEWCCLNAWPGWANSTSGYSPGGGIVPMSSGPLSH